MGYWTKTWHIDKNYLNLCHKVIERKDGKQIMIKDTTTDKEGTEVSNEWEFLNNTSERVAMIYNHHIIDISRDSSQQRYRQSYEYNFDPNSSNGKEALKALLDGKIVEGGERYYRLNESSKQTEYSEDKETWKWSGISVSAFLLFDKWNILD
jgi:hypothetical protein